MALESDALLIIENNVYSASEKESNVFRGGSQTRGRRNAIPNGLSVDMCDNMYRDMHVGSCVYRCASICFGHLGRFMHGCGHEYRHVHSTSM